MGSTPLDQSLSLFCLSSLIMSYTLVMLLVDALVSDQCLIDKILYYRPRRPALLLQINLLCNLTIIIVRL